VILYIGSAPPQVPVPNVVGDSQADAQTALTKAGLTLAPNPQTQSTNDPNQVGKVISQNPAAGTNAPANSPVSIVIGAQPTLVSVPDERGQMYDAAQQALSNAGFKVKKQTQANQAPAGTVLDMNPQAGTQVAQGTTVTLVVSDGSQAQITVPNLVGMTQSQAQTALTGLGWTGSFQVTPQATIDQNKDGQIVAQNPDQNTQITKNQTIQIQVLKFPTPTT
jgi:beta-lactam-binding protein with PASTA domain